MNTRYYLLGQNAIKSYQEKNSVDILLEAYIGYYDVLMIDIESDPYYVMEKVGSWDGSLEITQKEFTILYNALHPNTPLAIEEEFEFDFHRDSKHTIWYRSHFSVKAKTRDEAIEKAKAMMVNFDRDENSELLIDTTEAMSPSQNENYPTEELFIAWECGDPLWNNGVDFS
jgi:hypothetical protein